MSVMSQSLIITAIGMGLVFILIALLWVFMAALVSATNRLDFMAQVEEGEGISEKTKTESVEKPAWSPSQSPPHSRSVRMFFTFPPYSPARLRAGRQ
jgi:Na+-transporting methylmalonyl-CoA/oxaloacetate decarboxylase gamma subunit